MKFRFYFNCNFAFIRFKMSRHRNVRKLNIAEELEEDDEDDFYDYEEEKPISPETSKFLYQRPEFPTNQQQKQTLQIQQQQVGIAEPEEWEEYVDEGDEMFQMDEVVQPLKKPQATKSKPNSTREQQLKAQSAAKQQQPIVAVAPAVENLRINETAKVRSNSKSPGRTATPKQTLSNLEVAITATPKYKQRTRRRDEKQALNLVIVGHVDAGKSTLVGHLLYLLGNVDERSMHRYRQDSSQMGKSSFAFAWILDESEEERTRGVTMDIAHTSFLSPNGQKFNILDAPGHKDFIPNMISGATQADAALLVVNATRGEFETGFDQGGQTREHALLIRALGVSRLVVAINKLDTVDWSQDRFDELCAILSAFLLKRAGFESVQFVPVSGLLGVNLSTAPPSDHPLTQWHSTVQQTLVQALDSLPLSASSSSGAEQPLRAVCTDVLRYGPAQLVLSAKVECGHVEPGDRLFLMPEANPVTVKAVSIDEPSSSSSAGSSAALSALATAATKSADQKKQVCFAGDQATLTLAGAFEPDTIHPGHVLCRGGSELVMPCRHFRARLVTFDIQMPILRGTVAELFVQSLRVPCVISHLRVLHPGSKELEKRNPRLLPRNVSAIVDIRTEQPISVEPFARSKSLGRIALRAGGQTIAAGIVLELCP